MLLWHFTTSRPRLFCTISSESKKIRFETINSCDYSEELMPNIIISVRSVPAGGLVIVKCENMHYTLVTNIVVTAAKA